MVHDVEMDFDGVINDPNIFPGHGRMLGHFSFHDVENKALKEHYAHFAYLAIHVITSCPAVLERQVEATVALRKLLEARDAFERAVAW